MPNNECNGQVRIGCAGSSVGRALEDRFPREGTHLQRYGSRFRAVEINSSFYRPHRPKTYARWAAATAEDFRFAVKVSKTITHELRLRQIETALVEFLEQVRHLDHKLGVLLFQLPPSLAFDRRTAETCFSILREHSGVPAACEPRHPTWFRDEAARVLESFGICRVVADPPIVPAGLQPAGSGSLRYFRLHGSPRMYYSAYGWEFLCELASSLKSSAADGNQVWCIFDNTAAGAAIENALELNELLSADLRSGCR